VILWVASVIVIGLLAAILGDSAGFWVLYIIAVAFLVVAGLAVQIKRWHDRNKSGWWVLISLIPLIGPIWAIIETGFLPGTPGPNDHGPDPLEI
jgi:uncharacterized membrane protein YhaH (DUF805 family)